MKLWEGFVKPILNMESKTIYIINKDDLMAFLADISQELANAKQEEVFLSVNETAALTGKVRSTLWAWEKRGYLTPYRLGKAVKYSKKEIENLMQKRR